MIEICEVIAIDCHKSSPREHGEDFAANATYNVMPKQARLKAQITGNGKKILSGDGVLQCNPSGATRLLPAAGRIWALFGIHLKQYRFTGDDLSIRAMDPGQEGMFANLQWQPGDQGPLRGGCEQFAIP